MSHSTRASFEADELSIVLSYYDVGVVESITEFARGSRKSPKVGIVSERGKFLLKRRSMDPTRRDRVRFSHRVQLHLQCSGFPLPRLIQTRENLTSVQLRDFVYELFEFVPGQPYQRTVDEAREAGQTLARFHLAMRSFSIPGALPVPSGDYHDAPAIRTGLRGIESSISSHDSLVGYEAQVPDLIESLLLGYDRAAHAVNTAGIDGWDEQIIHSDWHPGNLLFRKQRVSAVIDFDSVRRSRRVVDVGNGALQFSILSGGDPAGWPEHLDEERFDAFLNAYEALWPLSKSERCSLPSLMIEALVAECVPPIYHTGSLGRWTGFRVLHMVQRKSDWLAAHAERLLAAADTDR